MPTLALIHTVSWCQQSVIEPFARHWLEQNSDVRMLNIIDDSLLAESLAHGGPTDAVIRRIAAYVGAAVQAGADVIMSSCTTMAPAVDQAGRSCPVPLFNIDEPTAREAVRVGSRLGILATVPMSAPATQRLLEREARALGKSIEFRTVIHEPAFTALLAGNRAEHDRLVHAEMDRLAPQVDAIVLGQISLARIQHRPGVAVLQVDIQVLRTRARCSIKSPSSENTPSPAPQYRHADFPVSSRVADVGREVFTFFATERLSAKVLVLFPHQTEPEHWHPPVGVDPGKEETIRVIRGTVHFYVPGDGAIRAGWIPPGKESAYTCRHELVLHPCDQLTLPPGTKHWFQAPAGGAVMYSFSTCVRDGLDRFSDPAVVRETQVAEDA